jgi:hypothetical protein
VGRIEPRSVVNCPHSIGTYWRFALQGIAFKRMQRYLARYG